MNILRFGIILLMMMGLTVTSAHAHLEGFNENRSSIYPLPNQLVTMPEDVKKSCITLDNEIVQLLPLTYSYVKGFYSDPYNSAAIFAGTTNILNLNDILKIKFPLAYTFLLYYGYEKRKENERLLLVHNRIETLRRAKASKRCFES